MERQEESGQEDGKFAVQEEAGVAENNVNECPSQ